MTKNQVLTQVYPDELDYVFDLKRKRKLEQFQGWLNEIIASSMAMGGSDEAKEYAKNLVDQIKKLSNNSDERSGKSKDKPEEDEEKVDQAIDKLQGLQQTIAQKSPKKGGGPDG